MAFNIEEKAMKMALRKAIKFFRPHLNKMIDGLRQVVDTEQKKHSDRFIFSLVSIEGKLYITGMTIANDGVISQQIIESIQPQKEAHEAGEFLMSMLDKAQTEMNKEKNDYDV